jgi:hypothetical protein
VRLVRDVDAGSGPAAGRRADQAVLLAQVPNGSAPGERYGPMTSTPDQPQRQRQMPSSAGAVTCAQ